MKVIFMGTPDFAKESLEKLYNNGHEIIAVVTNQDKPKGRGMKMILSPVKEFAIQKGLQVMQPEKIKDNPEFVEEIRQLNPDVICVVAYGKILPQELINIPKFGSINVHGSLLPKYRGAAPIQWAVLNGDKTTGITTMYMDVGMDTGDMLLKQEVEIGENETTGELWDRLAIIGSELLIKTLKQIKDGTVERKKQGKDFTIAPMINKEMAKINWDTMNAVQIKNLVRGLNPIMGAYTFYNEKKLKFWKVDIEKNNEILTEEIKLKENGLVVNSDEKQGLYIKTKDGMLKVIEIQGENAKKMNIGDFLRGNIIKKFEVFK